MAELTVVSCNMHMGVPAGLALDPRNERRAAIQDLASFLLDQECDVALIQEVRNDAPGVRAGGVPRQFGHLAQLIRATGRAFHPTIASGAGDEYGLAILTRRRAELVGCDAVRLPHGSASEPRALLIARLEVDGMPVVAVNLHLDFAASERHAQLVEAERVLQALLEHRDVEVRGTDGDLRVVRAPAGPLLVGGDFNDAAEAVAVAMARTNLVNIVDGLDHDHPLRADTHDHGGRIDHILLGPGLALVEQHLIDVPKRLLREGDAVTDHLAIVARVAVVDPLRRDQLGSGASYAAAGAAPTV